MKTTTEGDKNKTTRADRVEEEGRQEKTKKRNKEGWSLWPFIERNSEEKHRMKIQTKVVFYKSIKSSIISLIGRVLADTSEASA